MATKEKVKQGKHLTVTTRADGSVDLKWDWDSLLKEVQEATGSKVKSAKVTAKKDLVKVTEAKVTKSRAKATEKKPAVKKTTTAKKSAK